MIDRLELFPVQICVSNAVEPSAIVGSGNEAVDRPRKPVGGVYANGRWPKLKMPAALPAPKAGRMWGGLGMEERQR